MIDGRAALLGLVSAEDLIFRASLFGMLDSSRSKTGDTCQYDSSRTNDSRASFFTQDRHQLCQSTMNLQVRSFDDE